MLGKPAGASFALTSGTVGAPPGTVRRFAPYDLRRQSSFDRRRTPAGEAAHHAVSVLTRMVVLFTPLGRYDAFHPPYGEERTRD